MKVYICDLCKKIPSDREYTRYVEFSYGKTNIGLSYFLELTKPINRLICDKCFEKLENFMKDNQE